MLSSGVVAKYNHSPGVVACRRLAGRRVALTTARSVIGMLLDNKYAPLLALNSAAFTAAGVRAMLAALIPAVVAAKAATVPGSVASSAREPVV